MTDQADLSSRQWEIYSFIREKIVTRGIGPTVREIGEAFEIQSPNSVMCHLKTLVKKGLITRQDRPNRVATLLRRGVQADEEKERLRGHVAELETEVYRLKDEAKVRENYITDIKDQIRCPDCERPRSEWY